MVYPFCIYNSGPCFREKIERQFSTPFDLKAAKSTASNGDGFVKLSQKRTAVRPKGSGRRGMCAR
jgi:uncharacterized radical SAM superfamily Fe-S cluster-containing enzyme